jgi:hypothetical protein
MIPFSLQFFAAFCLHPSVHIALFRNSFSARSLRALRDQFVSFKTSSKIVGCIYECGGVKIVLLPATGPYLEAVQVCTLRPHFSKIQGTVLPSAPKSSNWCLYFRFIGENIVCTSHLYRVCRTSVFCLIPVAILYELRGCLSV